MRRILFITLLGTVLFSCQNDDTASINTRQDLQKDGESKIDCQDDINQVAGQYIITSESGKKYLGMWQAKPFSNCSGHCWIGKDPNGKPRYFQTAPLPSGMGCADYMDTKKSKLNG